MKRPITLAVIAGALGCFAGVHGHASSSRAATAPAAAVVAALQHEPPVIVRLVNRHQTITITAGPRGVGPLYSAVTADGKVLVSRATLQELRSEHPEIYRQIQPGVAMDYAIDASAASARD